MPTLSEMIAESKKHDVAVSKKNGQPIVKLSLFITLIITIAAPQLFVVVLLCALLDLCQLQYDGKPVLP